MVKRIEICFVIAFILSLSVLLMPATSAAEVSGKTFNVFISLSTGNRMFDSFVFNEDNSFYSVRGLEGTWSERGNRVHIDALYDGWEVHSMHGRTVKQFLVGEGESISDVYTYSFFGPESHNPAALPSEVHEGSYDQAN